MTLHFGSITAIKVKKYLNICVCLKYVYSSKNPFNTTKVSCYECVIIFTLSQSTLCCDDLQKPIDSDQQADVLSGQSNRCENQQHGHQSSTGDTGSSNTG